MSPCPSTSSSSSSSSSSKHDPEHTDDDHHHHNDHHEHTTETSSLTRTTTAKASSSSSSSLEQDVGVLNRLKLAAALCGTFLLVELVGGWWSHSLAVLSDAAHLTADLASLLVAVGASYIAAWPASRTHTYGLRRVEALAALLSMLSLALLSIGLALQALRRILLWSLFPSAVDVEVDGAVMALVAGMGVVVNIALAIVLGGHHVHFPGYSSSCSHDHFHDGSGGCGSHDHHHHHHDAHAHGGCDAHDAHDHAHGNGGCGSHDHHDHAHAHGNGGCDSHDNRHNDDHAHGHGGCDSHDHHHDDDDDAHGKGGCEESHGDAAHAHVHAHAQAQAKAFHTAAHAHAAHAAHAHAQAQAHAAHEQAHFHLHHYQATQDDNDLAGHKPARTTTTKSGTSSSSSTTTTTFTTSYGATLETQDEISLDGTNKDDNEKEMEALVVHKEKKKTRDVHHGNAVVKKKRTRLMDNVNLQAAYLHVLGDLAQSVAVFVAGLVLWYRPDWQVVDPVCTVVFCLVVLWSTFGVIRSSLSVLLEEVPSHVSLTQVLQRLQQVEGVENVHDLHIWSICHGQAALSVHVQTAAAADTTQALSRLYQVCFHEFGIAHCTIQVQPVSNSKNKTDCITCGNGGMAHCC